ncbi:uncharacterized protein [Palaemon carinicauda]|uniref:uncharacterized protein n=1 Tax=Palaemon carinicauda TaxID=392227 RepID=UPI0035B5FEA7
MMLIAVFAFGILFQAEALKILNNTDSSDGPSPVSALGVETEETTSYTSHPRVSPDDSTKVEPDYITTVSPEDSTTAAPDDSTIVTPDDSTTVSSDDSTKVSPDDSTTVAPDDSTKVSPDDSTTVAPDDSTKVSPDDSTTVAPDDSTKVTPNDSTTVAPDDSTKVSPDDSTKVSPDDSTTVAPDDSNKVSPDDSTTVAPDDSTKVSPDDSTTVSPDDSTTVTPDDSTKVSPDDSTTVSPDDSATVSPDDSTTVAPDNSTKVSHDDSTTVAPDDSTKVSPDDSTTVAPDDSTKVTPNDSTTVAPDDGTKVSHDDSTKVSPDDSTRVSPDDSTRVSPDDSTTVAPDDSTKVSPNDSTTVAPDDGTKVSHDDSTKVSPDDSTRVSPDNSTRVSPDDSTTVAPDDSTKVSPDDSTTVSRDNNPTEYPNVTNALTLEGSAENPFSKCPDIGGPQVAGSVVMCYCEGYEIYVNGKCQVYDGAILIPVQHDYINTKEENVSSYNVTVQDVNCDTSKHSFMNFIKNQFHIRHRGDAVLLKEAGKLEGQRFNNYCIFHHLDKYDQLTWTMKACVPIPSVPRCCPPGQAMKEGKCQAENTKDVLKPPISAKPFSDSIDWDNITEYESPLKCDSEYDPPITIPLGHKQSHLVSLADGVANAWVPIEADKRRVYYKCPEYCVDGIKNSEGSVDYFTSFCYSDPIETYKKLCANGTCLRKCCKYGYSMDKNRNNCVPDPSSTFTPSTDMELINYIIVIRYPLCLSVSKVEERFSVDTKGNLILKNREFTSTDFCVDTFLDNEQRYQSALACLTKTSLWSEVRPSLFSFCNFISLIFLMIIIVCHLLVPRLLANGGQYQLCHLLALSIAYATNFSVQVFHEKLSDDVCVDLAIALQFGFLATFFWLNVMCFEIWRKIRRLKSYRPCDSYPDKYYMMYGWGIPFLICVTTFLMQKYAPDNVWGVIKPYISVSRCWFREDIALLIYYFGPTAVLFLFNSVFLFLTYINFEILLQNYKEITNDLNELGAGAIRQQRIRSCCIPLRHIKNHVHDFKQKLKIFILMATCWVTKIFSWKILPLEICGLTDALNSLLQGFFLFIILLSNSNKRKHLKKKISRLFLWLKKSNKSPANRKKRLQNNVNRTISPTSSLPSSISSQFWNSSVFRTITTSVRSSNTPSSSSSSFYVQSSVSFDNPDDGVICLSHSSLPGSDSVQAPADASLRSSKCPEVTPDSSLRISCL